MRRKKLNPPPGSGGTYIKPNMQIAAIPLVRIAAIFYSTGLYIFVIAFTKTCNILFARVSALRQARAFLFQLKADKPSHDRPRCRSPPVLHIRFIK